jgi:uncharacterized protein (DUF924 family)
MSYQQVIRFWFEEIESKQQFKKDLAFDELVKSRFLTLHHQTRNCELYQWRETPLGALAEVIILDQFSRNIFRDQAEAFRFDNLALALAQSAIQRQHDQQLNNQQKAFLYMPFMHSESLRIHEAAVELFSQAGLENNLNFASTFE